MIELPNFLHRREQSTMSNGNGDSIPTLPPPVEAANALGASVARMVQERDVLVADLTYARQQAETLAAELNALEKNYKKLEDKAAFFERFAIELVTNFNAIRMLIDDTQRKANSVALRREEPTPQPPANEIDHVAQLEAALIASRNSQEGA